MKKNPSVVFLFSLLFSSCLPSSKFSNKDAGEVTDVGPIVVGGGGGGSSSGGSSSSVTTNPTAVNGGWGDNDLRGSSIYVLQKSCTSPAPANGGAACPNISGWTVFNAGGYQLARQCTNGGTNGRMVPHNGVNYFWCDAPAGFNNDGTAKVVNGGWRDDDLTATSAFVLQKSCTNPAPANGGARCPDLAGWTIFDAGGYQLARQCTKGGTNGRMVLNNGENYFWCDALDGYNNDGSLIGNVPAPAGYVADLKLYWPWPVDGTSFVKIFARETGNPSKLIQKHMRAADGTYTLENLIHYTNTNQYERHVTWHYRLDPNRGILEFRDGDIEYVSGGEIYHGNVVGKGTAITSPHGTTNNAYTPESHTWFQVFEIFSNFYQNSLNFKNVVAMNLKQFSCDTNQTDKCSLDYTHYYLAPGIGFVRQVWYTSDPSGPPKGEAILEKYCTTSSDKWHCD